MSVKPKKRRPKDLELGEFKLTDLREGFVRLNGCLLHIRDARCIGERLIEMADWFENERLGKLMDSFKRDAEKSKEKT